MEPGNGKANRTETLQRIRQAVKYGNQELVDVACWNVGLSPEGLFTRISEDEELQVLAVKAIEAAARTNWEHKVKALARSLASGMLSSDKAEVSAQQLIMSAIADIEVPHLALLDLVVAWCPPQSGSRMIRLDISEYSHSQPFDSEWSVGQRKWYVQAIQTYRPRLTPIFTGLVGTLQRHGLVIYESNEDDSSAIRDESYNPEVQRPYVEPTERGEHIWLRFYSPARTRQM